MTDIDERWRPVEKFEGLYEVSNLGRVRSVARWVTANLGVKLSEGRILAQRKSNAGYSTVCLCSAGEEKTSTVHRLVAIAFVPGTGECVRHLDGNKDNNCSSNLAWGTQKENIADKKRHGTHREGFNHPGVKTTPEEVKEIKALHKRGFSQMAISRELKVNRGTVGRIVRGEIWKEVR